MIPLADRDRPAVALFSYENLYRHYLSCRRNKRNTINALRFEAEQELNLLTLRAALADRSYRPGPSVCFATKRPKLREIFAADFRDRVVHHVLVGYLERYWERVFIHDSYACRKGKGVHAAVDRLQGFVREVTANGQRRAWYLQLDIRNYFMRIDKAILWRLLEPRIADADARWLTELLVFHNCTEGHIVKGRPGALERVPPHKTLLRCEPGKGLPIGNLDSQFFANVYLNGLDQLVKHQLKCRHYLRYCDDFLLLSPERDELLIWRDRIETYLREALALDLNPRERLRPVSDGIDFLGYIVRRDYRLVRRRVVNACKIRLRAYRGLLVSKHAGVVTYCFDLAELARLRAALSSYLGHFRRANAYRLWQALWQGHAWLAVYFDWDADWQRLVPRYAMPKGLTNVRQQYAWVRGRFPSDVALFQVGAYYELYDRRDAAVAETLRLKPLKENRRRALYGLPERLFGRYLARLLDLGRSVVVVRQGDQQWTAIRERQIAWRMVPAA
ncbi:MAG: reverse transcriptase domain-containing protein [Chromatiaceae bacterium]